MRELFEQIMTNLKIKLSIDIKQPGEKITEEDEQQDALLTALMNDAYEYMYIFFDCDEDSEDNYDVPAQLRFVLEGVVIKRYRRIGAEGIAIEKIDVLSTTYESGDDFAEYMTIMNQYKRRIGRDKGPKGFRFF
jgi:hypothetical protein